MNISTTSGCESGWTMYLDQTSDSATLDSFATCPTKSCPSHFDKFYANCDDDEEEDQSMLSDASSGPPPYFQEHESYAAAGLPLYGYASTSISGRNSKSKSKKEIQERHICLDDTASSPILHLPKENASAASGCYSQVLSRAHFESESIESKKHLGLFLSSSRKGKSGNSVGRKKQR